MTGLNFQHFLDIHIPLRPHRTVFGLAIVYMVCSNTERGDIQPHDIVITRTKDDSPPPHNVK